MVWMQYRGWGYLPLQSNEGKDYVCYWLNNGGMGFEDHCVDAENELARLGITIENLTMGNGLWGSEIWADYRNHSPSPTIWAYRPGCVGKN